MPINPADLGDPSGWLAVASVIGATVASALATWVKVAGDRRGRDHEKRLSTLEEHDRRIKTLEERQRDLERTTATRDDITRIDTKLDALRHDLTAWLARIMERDR